MKENFVTRTLAALLMQSGISYGEALTVLEEFKDDSIEVVKGLLELSSSYPKALLLGVTRSHALMRSFKSDN